MMSITDMNGGDMGLVNEITPIELLPPLVRAVGDILSQVGILVELPKDKLLSYCFKVGMKDKTAVELFLSYISTHLPKGVAIYESDGRKLFDIRGASGGVTTARCFYLITTRVIASSTSLAAPEDGKNI